MEFSRVRGGTHTDMRPLDLRRVGSARAHRADAGCGVRVRASGFCKLRARRPAGGRQESGEGAGARPRRTPM
jgi:hypothetical protein